MTPPAMPRRRKPGSRPRCSWPGPTAGGSPSCASSPAPNTCTTSDPARAPVTAGFDLRRKRIRTANPCQTPAAESAMPESPFRENLAYLRRHGTVGAELAAASGLGAAELADLERAGVVPQPTYRVGEGWVESAIGHCGRPDGPPVETYYGPAVVAWLQRAAVLARLEAPDVRTAMLDWLARDLAEALAKAGADAEKYGWSHVLRDGRPDRAL